MENTNRVMTLSQLAPGTKFRLFPRGRRTDAPSPHMRYRDESLMDIVLEVVTPPPEHRHPGVVWCATPNQNVPFAATLRVLA